MSFAPITNTTLSATEDVSDSFVFVDEGILVTTAGFFHAFTSSTPARYWIEGRVVADFYGMETFALVGIHVGKTGLLWGEKVGAVLRDPGASAIENEGTIFGSYEALWLSGVYDVTLNNSGTMRQGRDLDDNVTYVSTIYLYGDAPGSTARINNSGTISTDDTQNSYAIRSGDFGGGTTEIVINTGKIVGRVTVGAGNDKIDTTTGTIKGTIDMGAGTDTVYGSAAADNIRGGTENDTVRGNGGNDKLYGDGGMTPWMAAPATTRWKVAAISIA